MPFVRPFVRLLALICGAPLLSQCLPGTEVAAPSWRHWVLGEPVAVGGDAAPAATAYVFCTRRPAMLVEDAGYLRGLQQRFGARGFVVVAVVGDLPADRDAVAKAWDGCRIVLDQDGSVSSAWLGRDTAPWNVVLLDRQGMVAFVGTSDAGLVDVIEPVLDGKPRLDGERVAFSLRAEIQAGYDDLDGDDLVRQLDRLLQHAPHDGIAHGLRYVTEIQKRLAPDAAQQARTAALLQLAAEPRPLAAFADLALRCDPHGDGLAAALLEPLAAAVKAVPDDTVVRLAHLRASVLVGDSREVGRAAMRMQKAVLRSADACLDFVAVLATDKDAVVHRDLAQRTLARAEQLGANPRLLAAARYAAAVRCQEDAAAAKRLMDEYLGDDGAANLNNDCWYLMTDLATMGRFDWFAHGLAERMLAQRDAMQSHEFDTAALAMFQVGRVADAIELQQTAIAKGGNGPDYRMRLQRYQKAAAAMPPK
ncbi:MAG: hypothetical protein JNL08_15610 [Planctomycetes bacterium]|nr:hypothetical protein [Planctomycetota bacterium]